MSRTRRTLLAALALGGLGYAAWRMVPPLWFGRPETEDLNDPPGFRRLAGGDVTGGAAGFDPFLGLDAPDTGSPAPQVDRASVRADLCQALYGAPLDPGGPVPVASFSDVRCPICRVQSRRLADLAQAHPDLLRITWHEWPIFGESSQFAARAALAAGRQGRYLDMHLRLLRTPVVINLAYLDRLSASMGLDFAQLQADMDHPDVLRDIQVSQHLAAIFGFAGTPALVIGRTAISGAVSDGLLRQVLAMEAEDGWGSVC